MPIKGFHHSEETRKRMSLVHMGNKSHLGKHSSEETRKKLSTAHMGKHPSEETRMKLSAVMMGNKIGLGRKNNLGKHPTEETRKKLSATHSGERNHCWLGGLSFESYTLDWTRTLRRSIRERDKYTCRLCGEMQGDRAFSIHHIDYDKKNCSPYNLVTLCVSCHAKTNQSRDHWQEYFKTDRP